VWINKEQNSRFIALFVNTPNIFSHIYPEGAPFWPQIYICYNLFMKNLRNIAILGNIVFLLWITYNGIDEGFKGTNIQIASYIGLVLLLILNTALIYRKK